MNRQSIKKVLPRSTRLPFFYFLFNRFHIQGVGGLTCFGGYCWNQRLVATRTVPFLILIVTGERISLESFVKGETIQWMLLCWEVAFQQKYKQQANF
jgi:hypothetical protein